MRRPRQVDDREREITFHTPGPRAAMRAMARRMAGNGHQAVHDAHDHEVGAAVVAGDQPDRHAPQRRQHHRHRPRPGATRAPYSTRLRMSRPNSSVPRSAGAGGRRRSPARAVVGLYGDEHAGRERGQHDQQDRRPPMTRRCHQDGPGHRASPASAGAGGQRDATITVLDARVDDEVHHVHHQVDQHVRRGRDQHHALDHRIVPAQDRRDDEPPEPRDVEHDLGDHRAADEDGQGDADHGHHRGPARSGRACE